MTQREKFLVKFLKNPGSLSFSKIEILLINQGFEKIEAKGSHKKFKHRSLERDLIIPVHNADYKRFYKHLTAEFIKKLL